VKRNMFVCVFGLLLVCHNAAIAQQSAGQLAGKVSDLSGRPVPNLTIVIRNVVNGTEHQATTDQSGSFAIAQLEPGKYTLGNSTTVQTTIAQSSTTQVNVQQSSTGALQVQAETIIADSGTGQVKTVFGENQIELLPQPNVLNRTGQYFGPYNLSLLSEGVTHGDFLQPGVGPNVGGRPNTSNNYHVRGIDNNNHVVPGPLVVISNEATTDFSLMQAQQTPQLGHATGGQFNLFTTAGTNDWHGGVYGYLNNRKLNAIESGLGDETRRLRYDQYRLGGKVGGPLVKNTLFGFFDFEYLPLRTEQASFSPVLAPTAAGFATLATTSGVSTTNLNVLRNNLTVSDTVAGTATVGGVTVPLGRVNTGVRTRQNAYNGIANVDWTASARSNLGLRYVHNDSGTDAFGSTLPAFRLPGHTRSLLGAVNYTTTLTTVVVNAHVGYNRLDQTAGATSLTFPGFTAFPNISIQGTGLGLGSNVAVRRSRGNTYQGGASAEWTMGRNRLTAGGDFRAIRSVFGNFGSAAGNFGYSSLERFLLDLPPDVMGTQTFGSTAFTGNRRLFHGFVVDSLKAGGVDLELGVSYQYATLPRSVRNQSELSGLSVPGLITFDEPETAKLNFAPRIGLAWSPTNSQTVVRASFGMMYDALYASGNMFFPELQRTTFTNSALNTPGFLAAGGLTAPASASAGVASFVADQELPYTINWSGGVSHNLFGRLNTEVRYMGHHGVHQPTVGMLNGARVSATSSLPVFFTNPGLATLNTLTTTQAGLASSTDAFTTAGFTNPIMTIRNDGTSWYNAATLKFTETFTAGTQITAHYTYSDLRSEALGTPFDLVFGRQMEQVYWNQKHRAAVSTVIDIASMIPQTAPGVVRNVFANFSIAGTATYASSTRLPLFSGLNTGLDGNPFGTGVFVNPNGAGGTASGSTPLTNSSGAVVAFLATNPNAQFVSGGPGTFSTARPTMRLDDTRNIDLAIVKRFTVPDRARIEVRGEAFNLINHPQFIGLPVSSFGPGLGSSSVMPSFLVPSSPQFNDIRGSLSSNPRTIQLALRVLF
jgi:hypothetical protein